MPQSGSRSCVLLQIRFDFWGCAVQGEGGEATAPKIPARPVLAVVSDLCATGDHDCEQVCVSTPGAYRCACRDGFSLNSDGKTCTGT